MEFSFEPMQFDSETGVFTIVCQKLESKGKERKKEKSELKLGKYQQINNNQRENLAMKNSVIEIKRHEEDKLQCSLKNKRLIGEK